jgi:hypothetical protein
LSFLTSYRWRLIVAAVVLATYAALGFFLVPRIVASQLQTYATDTLRRELQVGEIRFNPFTFTVEVDRLALTEHDKPLMSFQHLLVNGELASVWQRRINLKEVRLDAPDAELVIDRDGSVNLAQLIPAPEVAATEIPAKSSEPPRIRIGLLSVSSGRVGIEDQTATRPFKTALTPIQFTLTEFKTDLNYHNAYTFSGVTLAGEQLEWSGAFTVQPLGSNGLFAVRKLKVATLQSYLPETLPFTLLSGELDLQGDYRVSLDPTLSFDVHLPTVAVSSLAIAERGVLQPTIALERGLITGIAMSYAQRSLGIKKIELAGATVDLRRDADGALNIDRLFAANEKSAEPIVSTPSASSSAVASGAPWKLSIEQVAVDGAMKFADSSVKPSAQFELNPLSFSVDGWSNATDAKVKVMSEAIVNAQGKWNIQGDIHLSPLNATVDLQLDEIPLPLLQPYIAKSTQLTLHTGTLSARGAVNYDATKSKPSMRWVGDVGIDNLRTTDNLVNEDFVKWKQLGLIGVRATVNPDRVSIEKVIVKQPYARVVIAADKTVNASYALSAETTAVVQDQRTASPSSAKAETSKPLPMRINQVQIVDGAANFADYSIQPNFATAIVDLYGTINGLSSDPASRAQVQLVGKVDRYAPVDVNGEINVLSAAKYSNVALNFSNMELTTFNPYSGKFAGYSISKGKLTTQLRYRVEDRKLDAQHHVVIDNLEFGEKTDSKDAAPIPLKLAIAVLKDRNGVIDLDLPIAGTLDDPQFRLAPIIWDAFVGVLKKVATAPFAAIGALFGGGDELAYVDFKPGSAVLSDLEREKLKKVSQALVERPELKLNIPLTVVGDSDAAAIADQKLAALQAPTTSPIAQQIALLEMALKKNGPLLYPSEAAFTASTEEVQQRKLEFLRTELLKAMRPDAASLDVLAKDRAGAVQAALLTNTELDAPRIFLINERSDQKENGALVRMEMTLE